MQREADRFSIQVNGKVFIQLEVPRQYLYGSESIVYIWQSELFKEEN